MNKKSWLDKLFYEFDKQRGNLELAYAFKDAEGNPKFSKWKKYLDCDGKFISKANNRTILPNEIILDLEEPERFSKILEGVKKEFEKYSAYKTGSKGYHVHLWFSQDLTQEEKLSVIKEYGCDEQKATERSMIALENCPHWKTGNPKIIVEENRGINDCNSIKKEVELKREFEAKKEIIDLLNKEELNSQYLDLGEVNEKWYYGFKIKGREAIITSLGNIYRNTEMKTREGIFGVNEIKELFNYEGNIGEIAPIISKETIKKYYTKNSRNHLINPKEIYQTIRDKILYYMDFSGKDEIADVLTCWIIATYFYPLFYWFAHLLFNAPSTSGKSKGAFIVIQMSFRGFDLGASAGVTPPQIFRTLEGNRGTILIDEFEQQQGALASDSQRLVNQIMNASASRDAYIIRPVQEGKSWVSKKFPIFCPKISCNISGINPTSLSRYIAFSWLKSKSEKSKRKPQREKDKKSFAPIREDLYILALERWKEVKNTYDNLEIDLLDRDEDNWLPLFAIGRFIDKFEGNGNLQVEEQLKKYLADYRELQVEGSDNIAEFFQVLLERADKEEKYYTPKEIGEWSQIQDLFSYLKSPSHKVGKVLKDYKFKNTRGGGVKRYLISKEQVQKIIELYFNTEIMPHKPTINTKPHKQHKTSQTTLEKEKKEILKENVVLGGVSGIIDRGKGKNNRGNNRDINVNEVYKVNNLLNFIKEKNPESVNFSELKENFPEKDLEANLKHLQETGVIFSPKENYWRFLG